MLMKKRNSNNKYFNENYEKRKITYQKEVCIER